MRSPNGTIEVVRTKSFTPANAATWCGWIEIRGGQFFLLGRRFTHLMVFSPDSRFLALTEMTVDGKSRITVLDFCTEKEAIAYDEKSDSTSFSVIINSLDWTDEVTLRIGISTIRQS